MNWNLELELELNTWGAHQKRGKEFAMADEERPFKAEYAKSGRAGCKLCKGAITKDTLRMAKMVQVS